MKKILYLLLPLTLLLFALVGCGPSGEGDDPSLKNISGVTFSDQTVTYDGTEHAITVTGTLPQGVSVEYADNTGTDAGTYRATANLSGEGYNPLTLHAVLTIEKAVITGVTFSSEKFLATGQDKELFVEGTIPEGVSVTYTNNRAKEEGTYHATAVLSGKNYETLTLNATLTIYSVADIAQNVLNTILNRPDPWTFLPEGLQEENMAYSALPANDFTSFVNVDQIGKKAIGKQMNVLYDTLGNVETALKAANAVFTAGEAIAQVYQTFINNNPENYSEFTGEADGFKVKITLQGDESVLLAGNSTLSIELRSDGNGTNYGRIQITGGAALKYESSENHLKLAIQLTVSDVGYLQQLEFIRDEDEVVGYLYEYVGAESAALKTSAVIHSDAERTTIMSNKRESDDLIINGYEEVYHSQTGEMIGGEVAETVKTADYDTYWFSLSAVNGISTVRVTDEENDSLNANTVYINGTTTAFVPEYNKILGVKTSRHYDIEMKEVWYVVKTVDGDDVSYDKVKISVPMLFVQKPNLNDFSSEAYENNKSSFSSAPTCDSTAETAIGAKFATMQETFLTIKEEVTFSEITAYIGENNSFFNA